MLDGLENVDNATQEEVVDPLETMEEQIETNFEDEVIEDVEGVEETQDDSEVTEPKDNKQSKEENAQYAKMRRKAEEEARTKFSKEREELEATRKEIETMKRKQEEARIEQESINSITLEKVYEKADELGVTEKYARELLVSQAKNEATQKKAEYYEKMEQIQEQKSLLKEKPFFSELEAEIDVMIKNNPALEVKTAYTFLKGEKADELYSRQSKKVEKSTIANMQDKARRKPLTGDGTTNTLPERSDFAKEFDALLGVDPAKSAEIVAKRRQNRGY